MASISVAHQVAGFETPTRDARVRAVWASTALLDRLVWVSRNMLEELVAELHPERHAAVAAQIRELIGN